MPRKRTVGGLFDGSAMPLGLPGCVLGLAILLLVVSGGREARADLVITTTPGDGGTLDFGPTLVGNTSSQILTATSDTSQGSDSGGVGVFGGATDLSGNASTVFGPTTSSQFNLGFAGDSANSTYTYSPLVRGIDQGQVQVSYGSNGQAADGSVAATINLTGQGVAPVVALDQSKNDAGFVLVGQTGTSSVTVQNTGDGNKSGQGAVSNLNGGISSGSGAFALQGGSGISLGDGSQQTFNYAFTPSQRGSFTQGLSASFSNGSTDGTNQANTQNFQVSGTGVAPVSTPFDQSKNNAGYTLVGTSNTASVSVTNIGDGNKSGLGSASNLNGGVQAGAGAFSLNGGSTFSLKDSQTGTFNYDFKPTERGASTQTMTANFSNGSSDGTNSAHARTYQVTGIGVAPVSAGVSNGDAGYTLVGTSKNATVSVSNIGDGNKSGLGAISNLNGNVATGSGSDSKVSASVGGFALQGSSAVSLGDGQKGTFNYAFTPTQRGIAQASLTANFSNGSADSTNSAHAENYLVRGQGVAPVNSFSKTDAGLTRIGTTNTASISITNLGDGNKSGLPGSISNLNGSAGGASGRFTGSGGSFSIGDSGSQKFNYQYAPTSHGVNTAAVSLNFANGSSDGRNASEAHNVVLSGQGVGPNFESSRAPNSLLNFGAINPRETADLPLSIWNSSTDPNGGNHSLTDLTLLSYSFTGSDASLFSLKNFTEGMVLHKDKGNVLDLLLDFDADEDTPEGWKYADLTFVTDQGAALGLAGAQFTFHLQGYVNPEPSSLMLLGTGVVCLAGYSWRRRRQTSV